MYYYIIIIIIIICISHITTFRIFCSVCPFSGAFAKLWKACQLRHVSFVHMEQLGLPLDGFSWNLTFDWAFFENLIRITGNLHEMYVHLWYYVAEFYLEWEIFQIKVVKKSEQSYVNFFSKIVPFMSEWKKYGRTGQTTDDYIIRRRRFMS